MGCDIHVTVESRVDGKWIVEDPEGEPFSDRNYSVFAFLAGVRNYSAIKPISEPRGVPADMADITSRRYGYWANDAHSASWLLVSELKDVDYAQVVEDRRTTRQIGDRIWSGGETAEVGLGKLTRLRDYLSFTYFNDLDRLCKMGNPQDTRIVFWFDN